MNARVELPPAREVCPTTTRRLIAEGALLVDVRELAEVAQVAFDVPGVLLLPLSEFEQRFAELPRDRDLVLVCQVGARSLKATYFLMYQGYTRVANLEGGLLKWARKGFPIKGAQPAPAAGTMASGCCGAPAPAQAATSCCGRSAVAVADAESPAGGGCCSPAPGSGVSCC
jgi:rhodanese-related sulfurtransferase